MSKLIELRKENKELRAEIARLKSKVTKREREVIMLVAQGKNSREIGEILKSSIRTIETHRANLMGKLGLKNTAEVVRYAYENGLVTIK